jgi:hypothetical protein
MNENVVTRLNAAAVAAYKAVGFVVLAGILLAVLSYVGVQTFFLLSDHWVTPAVVASTDEDVLRLSARVAEIGAARDRVAAQRRELLVRAEEAERRIVAEEEFQDRYRRALASDRASRAQELQGLVGLHERFKEAEAEIATSSRAYAGLSRTRADDLRAAALLDRERFLATNHQLAQIASANLTLAEHGVTLRSREAALRTELAGLDVLSALARGERAPAASVGASALSLHQQLVRSRLELEGARSTRQAALASLAELEGALARYDRLLDTLGGAPLLRAAEGNVTLAFVPYENIAAAHEGAMLYGCRLEFVVCRQVGTVRSVLSGETTMRHPIRNRMLRGVFVELTLTDSAAARADVLHLDRKPLLF